MKKVLQKSVGLIALSLILTSCYNRRVLPAYYHEAQNHRVIAVLPVQIFNQDLPEMTSEELTSLQTEESLQFQEQAYYTLLQRLGKRQFQIKVDLQSRDVTNGRLKDLGIDIEQSWTMDPVYLADLLGVDAVVKLKLYKDKIELSQGPEPKLIASNSEELSFDEEEEEEEDEEEEVREERIEQKYKMKLRSELIDGRSGSLLWFYSKDRKHDQDYSLEDAFEDKVRAMLRRFPYKNFEIILRESA